MLSKSQQIPGEARTSRRAQHRCRDSEALTVRDMQTWGTHGRAPHPCGLHRPPMDTGPKWSAATGFPCRDATRSISLLAAICRRSGVPRGEHSLHLQLRLLTVQCVLCVTSRRYSRAGQGSVSRMCHLCSLGQHSTARCGMYSLGQHRWPLPHAADCSR